jgi:hypothetical protein
LSHKPKVIMPSSTLLFLMTNTALVALGFLFVPVLLPNMPALFLEDSASCRLLNID